MGTPGEFPIMVKENGMTYAVHLNDGAMTGIFLDQREVRLAIRERYANNTDMLNTFMTSLPPIVKEINCSSCSSSS